MASIYLLSSQHLSGVKNMPVIEIHYHDKQLDLAKYEALIFTSKNGVRALDRVDNTWQNKPSYVIGEGSAKAVEELNGIVFYQSMDSGGNTFANEIKQALKGKKALFIRAKEVASSLSSILKDAGVFLDEEILYETKCVPCSRIKKPEKDAIFIFSSPSTISCFLNCIVWDDSYQAVVIGAKTASSMPAYIPYYQAPKQTIDSCIELANRLSKKAL